MSILDFQDDSKINVGDSIADAPSTTFTDVVGAAFDETVARGLTISDGLGIEKQETERDKIYERITGSNNIYQDAAQKFLPDAKDIYTVSKNFTKIDKRNPKVAEAVDKYISQLRDSDPEKYKELGGAREIKEKSLDARRRTVLESQDTIQGASGTAQFTGSLVGGIGANFIDPVNVLASAFGAGAASGFLKTAVVEAGINIGAEALMIPSRIDSNKELGFEYGKNEIAMDLISAGAFGAGLPVFFKAVGKSIDVGVNKLAEVRAKGIADLEDAFKNNLEGRTAVKTLERDLHQQGLNLVDEAGELNYKKHESGLNEAKAAYEEGRAIDSRNIDLSEEEFMNIKPDSIKDPIARQQLKEFQADLGSIRADRPTVTATLDEKFDTPTINSQRVQNQVELQERYNSQATIDAEVSNFKEIKTDNFVVDGDDGVPISKEQILNEFEDSKAVEKAMQVCGVA